MRKLKKYIYPIIFSVAFLISCVAVAIIIDLTFAQGDYGGLGLAMLFLLVWIMFVLPIYCARYCKIIVDEKLKLLFLAYNSLLIVVSHILPFNLKDEPTIIILFIFWVLFWSAVPILSRSASDKQENNDNTNDTV